MPWLAAGLALALATMALARKIWRSWVPWGIAVLLVFGTMLPVLGFLRYTDFDYCDRYNHLVSMVLWGSLAVLFSRRLLFSRWRRPTLVILSALAVVSGLRTLFYHQTAWQSDEALAIYCLTRPGAPNLKALERGLAAGCSHANPDLLFATAQAYLSAPELRMVDGEEVPAALRELIADSLIAHAHFLSGDRQAARPLLAQVEASLETAAAHSFSMRYLAEFLYRDLAALAADRQDKAAALHYLELEAKYLPAAPDHPATRQNRELRTLLMQ